MENNILTPFSDSGKWGFRGLNNEILIEAAYDTVTPFDGGFSVAATEGKYCLLNTLGKKVLEPVYDDITPREDLGGYAFKKEGKWGFISLRGEKTEPRFEEIGILAEGLIPVSENGKWGFVNSRFETVIPFGYTSAKGFRNGVALVMDDDGNRFMIDHANRVVSDESYKYITTEDHRRYDRKHLNEICIYHHSLPNGLKVFRTQHHETLEAAFDPKIERFVLDKLYHSVRHAGGDFMKAGIVTGLEGRVKWGVFDLNGDQILPVVFDDVAWIGGSCFAFKNGSKWGVVTRGLEVVLEPVSGVMPNAMHGLLKSDKISNLLVWRGKTDSELGNWIAGRLIDFGFKPAKAGDCHAFYDPSGTINYYSYEIFDENRVNHKENAGLSDELRQESVDYLTRRSKKIEMTLINDTTDSFELFNNAEGGEEFDLEFLIDSLSMNYEDAPADISALLNDPASWMLSQAIVRMELEPERPDFENLEDDYAFFGLSLGDGDDFDGDEWLELDEDGNPIEDEEEEDYCDDQESEDEDKPDDDDQDDGDEEEDDEEDEEDPVTDEETDDMKAARFLKWVMDGPDVPEIDGYKCDEFNPDFVKWENVFPEDKDQKQPVLPERGATYEEKMPDGYESDEEDENYDDFDFDPGDEDEEVNFDEWEKEEEEEQEAADEPERGVRRLSGRNRSIDHWGKGMIVDADGTPLYISKKSNIYHWGEGSYIEFEEEAFGEEATLLNSRFEPLDPSIHPVEIDTYAGGGHLRVVSNGYYGMVDRNGDLVIEPVFRALSNFHGGTALGITPEGTMLISDRYEYRHLPVKLERFHSFNGRTFAGESITADGLKWGLMNIKGEVLIPFEYELILPVGHGACLVRRNGLFGLVDGRNTEILPLIWKGYITPSYGLLPLRDATGVYRLYDIEKRVMLETFNAAGTSIPLDPTGISEPGEGFVVLHMNEGTEYLNIQAPAPGRQIVKPGS